MRLVHITERNESDFRTLLDVDFQKMLRRNMIY